jgi:hypothetical protein
MSRRGRWLALALALGASGGALATGANQTLYVRTKNTRLQQSPSPTATVVTLLQPSEPVVWKGVHPEHKKWHQVEVRGQSGYVFQSNLSTKPPSLEIVAGEGAGKVDARAFASSGAAMKGVSSGVLAMGEQRVELKESILQLDELERFVREQVKGEDVIAHARRAGLEPPAPQEPQEVVPASQKKKGSRR